MRFFGLMILILTFSFGACKEKKTTRNAERMRKFVIDIARYARQTNPDFLIIPQNGVDILFNDEDTNAGFSSNYAGTISAVGQEEIFYNEVAVSDNYNELICRKAGKLIPVLSSDFPGSTNRALVYTKNIAQGFIPFPRVDYDYSKIPDEIPLNVNSNDINVMSNVKNYLYIIGENFASKEDFLSKLKATNYDLIIMDLFFEDTEFSKTEIESLKVKANGGKRKVIAYMNIGAAEKYRYYYKKHWIRHLPIFLKKKYNGYRDETWVKFWNKRWQKIIYGNDESYTKKILDAGFDGTYLDNIEAYYFLNYSDK